jgi:hypothetical protein
MVRSMDAAWTRDAHVVKHRRIEHVDPASPIDQDLMDLFAFEQESYH